MGRLSHKRLFLYFIAISFVVITGQFILFRWELVYGLNLKSRLYDHASWIVKPPEVIIMGSSLARYGIIPSLIWEANGLEPGSVCNLGADAATPFEMYETYSKQRRLLSKVKLVYYTVEPWIFSTKYYRYKKFEKIYLTYRQWDLLHQEFQVPNEYFVPIRIFVDSLEFKKTNEPLLNGYIPLPGTHRFPSSREFQLDYEPYEGFPISRFQLSYLRKLKDMVEMDGGTFICVFTPKNRRWYQYYERYCRDYHFGFVSLFNRYVGPVRIIGRNGGTSLHLTDADFFDLVHLNDTGARLFTAEFFADINRHVRIKPTLLDSPHAGHDASR